MPETKNKKLIIIILIISVVIIAAGTTYVLFLLNNGNKNNSQKIITPTKAQADNLRSQAIEAIKNNQTDKAKALLEQAHDQYQALKDTNDVVGINSLLNIVNQTKTPPKASTTIYTTTSK